MKLYIQQTVWLIISYMSTIIDVFEELIQYLAGASNTICPQKSVTPSNISITPHYMLWAFGPPLQRQLQDTILSLITEQESPLSYKNWERHTVRFTPVDSSGAWSLPWQNASELQMCESKLCDYLKISYFAVSVYLPKPNT